jgi:hypothetical protein
MAFMHSLVIASRPKALRTLIARSKLNCTIDVQPHDQVVLLFACVDDDTNRRVVAARRTREDETEESDESGTKERSGNIPPLFFCVLL